ncbi:MAG: signal peptidase I [Candidatus Sungbacteria bacterium]|nr:signal peptidase I [Candidatus Sungbacteria bacterium]
MGESDLEKKVASEPPKVGFFRRAVREVWDFGKILFFAALIVIPIRYFIAQPFIVKGASMEPTFHEYNYLIVDEVSYLFREPARGEVVVFRFPLDPSDYFIKRVIGLPGETVTISGGKVMVADSPESEPEVLHEPYLPEGVVTSGERSWMMKPDEYFVMGDNRAFSLDSRRWGVLPKENITGRVAFRAWPIAAAGFVPFEAPTENP